jgi:hypothetical protein
MLSLYYITPLVKPFHIDIINLARHYEEEEHK